MRRHVLSVAAVFGLALSFLPGTSTAVAGSSYSVGVSVTTPVVSGQSFTVRARGAARQKALLYLYLDSSPCQATSDQEGPQVGPYKKGEPYFWQNEGGHMVKEPFTHAWVSGSFDRSRTAHAGSDTGREYACAYLDRPNSYGGYRVTVAHASTHFTVRS